MKRRSRGAKRATRASHTRTPSRHENPRKPPERSPVGQLEKILALIGAHPGIRPSELNRLLKVEQSDRLRDTLIKRGLIRKEKDGSAMRYYLV